MSGHIVIVEPVPTQRIMLRALLDRMRYRVDLFATMPEALVQIGTSVSPDLVLLRTGGTGTPDLTLLVDHFRPRPSAVAGHVSLADKVAFLPDAATSRPDTDPDRRDMSAHPARPVIVAMEDGSLAVAAQARVAALRAGADDVISRPYCDPTFLARIRNLLRARAQRDEARPGPNYGLFGGLGEKIEAFAPQQRIVVMTPRADAMAALDPSGAGLTPGLSPALAGLVARAPGRYEIALPLSDFDEPKYYAPGDRFGLWPVDDSDMSAAASHGEGQTMFCDDPLETSLIKAFDDSLAQNASAGPAQTGAPGHTDMSPDLIILDAAALAPDGMMPGHIFRLLAELRGRPATRFAAQLLILPPNTADLAAMALDLGVDDLVTEDVSRDELSHRIETLLRQKTLADQMRRSVRLGLEAAVIDPLTGLHNRRFALPHLAMLAQNAQINGRSYAVMMLDIDFFKAINDTYGHSTGDTVLCAVARRLRAEVRSRDLVARIGGEEFLVAMPDTGADEAGQMAERLRHAIAARPFDGNPPEAALPQVARSRISVTLSVGVAIGGKTAQPDSGITDLFDQADAALYAAKEAGRNTVTLSSSAA